MARGLTIVDMAAIVEATPVAEPMARDDGAGVVHERSRQTPPALIEIARGAGIMPGVGDMTPMGQAADMPWLIARSYEVGDQRLEARREMACNRDRSSSGRDRHHAAAMLCGCAA